MKILHLRFNDAYIFYKKLAELNQEIMSKHVLKNLLLKMCGDTPIPTNRFSIMTEILKNKDLQSSIDKSFYEDVESCVDKSYYMIDTSTFLNSKGNLYSEFINGLPTDTNKEMSGKTCVYKNYYFDNSSVVTYERLKQVNNMTSETYVAVCELLSDVSKMNTDEHSLIEIIGKIMNTIDEKGKKKIITFLETYKETYNSKPISLIEHFLSFLIDPASETKYDEKENRYIAPNIRFNRGQRKLLVWNDIKRAISVKGEIMLFVNDNIFSRMMKFYSHPTIFDGGSVKIIDILNTSDISIDYIINMGFKPVKELSK